MREARRLLLRAGGRVLRKLLGGGAQVVEEHRRQVSAEALALHLEDTRLEGLNRFQRIGFALDEVDILGGLGTSQGLCEGCQLGVVVEFLAAICRPRDSAPLRSFKASRRAAANTGNLAGRSCSLS